MRFALTLFAFLICVPPALGQWNKDGERVGDTPDRKMVNGFGAHLLIVQKPKEFIEEWKKPERPKIKIASEANRGDLYGVFVLFAGCKVDDAGICNSEVDYIIYKPDGSIYAEQKDLPLWKDRAPPPPNIQLSRAILGVRFEKKDPLGEYRVKARVRDLNATISFELETKIRVKD